jgi:hypothetical protein
MHQMEIAERDEIIKKQLNQMRERTVELISPASNKSKKESF